MCKAYGQPFGQWVTLDVLVMVLHSRELCVDTPKILSLFPSSYLRNSSGHIHTTHATLVPQLTKPSTANPPRRLRAGTNPRITSCLIFLDKGYRVARAMARATLARSTATAHTLAAQHRKLICLKPRHATSSQSRSGTHL